MTRPPAAFFGENVNNQGCFATQRLDLVVALTLTNNRRLPIIVVPASAVVIVDGERHPFRAASWQVGGQRFTEKLEDVRIASGQTVTVKLRSSGFLGKAALSRAERLEIEVPTGGERTVVVFGGVRDAPLRDHGKSNVWEAKW
ncbi:MAG: hypothetical protein HYY84_06110 [Deltaproteobacteria bacterium]|nr:hypothetical protein [Deltaproteobacteria bacterium]